MSAIFTKRAVIVSLPPKSGADLPALATSWLPLSVGERYHFEARRYFFLAFRSTDMNVRCGSRSVNLNPSTRFPPYPPKATSVTARGPDRVRKEGVGAANRMTASDIDFLSPRVSPIFPDGPVRADASFFNFISARTLEIFPWIIGSLCLVYQGGRSRCRIKVKNRKHPAFERVKESFAQSD
jgi:hypothetical protein